MELLQFRYFLEAARYENLTRAADELHIAQPALSQSIMRLENELGVKLFDRRNHHVYLNDQGKLLRKRLIPLMESIDSLKDELWESVCSSEKTISLNFFAASQFITNCIIAYKAEHPDVKFQVSQLETMGGCDIHIDSRASVYGPTAMGEIQMPEGQSARRSWRRRFIWLCPPTRRWQSGSRWTLGSSGRRGISGWETAGSSGRSAITFSISRCPAPDDLREQQPGVGSEPDRRRPRHRLLARAVLGRTAGPTGEADPHPLSRLPPGRGGDHVQAGTGEAGGGEFVDYLCGYFKRGLKDEDR